MLQFREIAECGCCCRLRSPLPLTSPDNFNVLRSCVSKSELSYSPKMHFSATNVTFLALAAPPVDGNGIALSSVLMPSPVSSVSNLGWIGRSVCDLWHFL